MPINPEPMLQAKPRAHEQCRSANARAVQRPSGGRLQADVLERSDAGRVGEPSLGPAEINWRYPSQSTVELYASYLENAGVAQTRFYAHRDNLSGNNGSGLVEVCSSRSRCRLTFADLASHTRTRNESSAKGIHVEVQGLDASGRMVARGIAVVPDPFQEPLDRGRFFMRRRLLNAETDVHAFEYGIERTYQDREPPLSVCATVGAQGECWPLAHAERAPTKDLGNGIQRVYLRSRLTMLGSRVFRVSNLPDHRRACSGHSAPDCHQSEIFIK